MPFKISEIRKFINQERVYMLMLSFIFLVNAWVICVQKIPGLQESFAARKLFGLHLIQKETPKPSVDLSKIDEKELWDKVMSEQVHLPKILHLIGLLIISGLFFGLYLDVRILAAVLRKSKIVEPTRPHLSIKWSVWDIFKLVIIFVFLGYLFHMFESSFFSFLSLKEIPAFMPLLNTGLIDLVLLGFIFYFVRVKYKQKIAALGLTLKKVSKNIFMAIAGYLAFLPLLFVLMLILIAISAVFDYQPPPQLLFKVFLEERRLWLLIYSTLTVVLLGPIVEEVFFRGFAYNALKKKWGRSCAMILTSVVFAALHGNLIGFLPITLLGLLLVYMYEKTGSLIPSITIHILHNSLMVSFLFLGRYLMRFVA